MLEFTFFFWNIALSVYIAYELILKLRANVTTNDYHLFSKLTSFFTNSVLEEEDDAFQYTQLFVYYALLKRIRL